MLNILKWCKPYFAKYKKSMFFYVLFLLLVTITSIIMPYIAGDFIDSLVNARDTSFLRKYIAIFIIIGILNCIAGYVVERLYCIMQMKTSHAISSDAIHHVQNVTSNYIEGKDAVFVNRQIDNDANMISMFCLNVPVNVIVNIFTVVLPLILVSKIEFCLGIAMVLLNCIYFLIYIILRRPMYNASYALSEEQSAYFARLNEQLCNIKFIQIHGLTKRFILRLEESLKIVLEKLLKHQRIRYAFSSSDSTLKTIANIIVFAVGGAAVVKRNISIGQFTILLSYFSMSIGATQYFFTLGESIQENKVSCDRLQEIFDVVVQTNGSEIINDIEEIKCRTLSFGYDSNDLISNFEFQFKKGNVYAIAGENGTGKSTLLNLILGIYADEYSGSIEYNGVCISKLNMQYIRDNMVGVSEQEPMLLPETLKFNITLDDLQTIDYNEFMKICSVLNLDTFFASLPEGLDTTINEKSSNISGGEKQKLSILRALLKKPYLLVLDEPTSALDKLSKQNLCNYLKEISVNMITIISTHDKELLDICDKI